MDLLTGPVWLIWVLTAGIRKGYYWNGCSFLRPSWARWDKFYASSAYFTIRTKHTLSPSLFSLMGRTHGAQFYRCGGFLCVWMSMIAHEPQEHEWMVVICRHLIQFGMWQFTGTNTVLGRGRIKAIWGKVMTGDGLPPDERMEWYSI